ncbi:MAG: DUF1684 domain-containing protein [Bacteroidota bacterium]
MKKYIVLSLIVIAVGCNKRKELTVEELKTYESELTSWHAKRIEDLKAPNGWINLVGLYWLEPGINTFGTDEKNKIVFPAGTLPAKAGYLLVKDNSVLIYPEKDVAVLSNGSSLTNPVIFHPDSAKAPQLEYGSLRWNIIKRDQKLGIRVRDLESEDVKSFTGVERYPVNTDLRLEARFEKSDSTKTIDITNILGQTTAQRSPGTLVFQFEGEEFRLDALKGGKDELFIIFADATSGKETYGGGRFLYVKLPDEEGKTIIDFNKAYNPPCVFTSYATCPLPPAQNVLTVPIRVGEKNYGHDSHAKQGV